MFFLCSELFKSKYTFFSNRSIITLSLSSSSIVSQSNCISKISLMSFIRISFSFCRYCNLSFLFELFFASKYWVIYSSSKSSIWYSVIFGKYILDFILFKSPERQENIIFLVLSLCFSSWIYDNTLSAFSSLNSSKPSKR